MTRIMGVCFVVAVVLLAAYAGTTISRAGTDRTSPIIFDHSMHAEFGVECETCHATVVESESGTTNDLPTMDACAECHDVEDESQCSVCHMDPSDPMAAPRISRVAAFSHRSHLVEVSDCLSCHPGIAEVDAPSLPDHDHCFLCHDGLVASKDCGLCHEGELAAPADHGLAYGHTHRFAVDIDAGRCETCHGSSDLCSECHAGENIEPPSHSRDFLFTHPIDLQSRMYECTSCHALESFCAECHMDLGVVPPEHRSAEWILGSNLHGLRAQQDIEACASCHQQGEPGWCATCHSDLDGIKGTDTDIHPTGFGAVSLYGPWMDDPGHFCFECHVDTRDTPEFGFCNYCHERKSD